jgi:hypothetical protein
LSQEGDVSPASTSLLQHQILLQNQCLKVYHLCIRRVILLVCQ